MRRALLFLCCILSCVPGVSAQSRRAQQSYDNALQSLTRHDWPKAERTMRRAIREQPGYIQAYGTLAQWLLARHDYKGCVLLLQEAEKNCANGTKIFAKPLVTALLGAGDYNAALQRITTDTVYKKLQAQAIFQQSAAHNADTAKIIPVGTQWRINTGDPELFPFLAADGKSFYYTRRVNGIDEDFYVARPDTCDGGWLNGVPLGSPFNTAQQEAAESISADRHYLFFMRCDNRSSNAGWDQGGCDLYMAYAADSVWSIPQSFGGTINTPGYEGMPCLSPDNRELYFVSDRPGGYGGLDLWSSRFERGLWQMPVNLGPKINTTGNETAPFICTDGLTLFFASDGHPGMGGTDLYVAKKSDTTWSAPSNLGMPLNTPFDEASPSVSADGSTFFFASDRDSAAGNFDLYQTQLGSSIKPAPITFFKGDVHDSLTGQRLNYANLFITDSATGKELYQVVSNRGDGSYTIALPVGHTYAIYADRIAYQPTMDTFRCYTIHADTPERRSFAMLPFGYQKPVKDSLILTLHFAKNSTELADSAKALLNAAMQAWQGKPGIAILVNGYTDNSGTPILNEQLSYKRAGEVSNALQQAGFATGIIQSQGWGEASPVAANDTAENRDLNRRVEVVIRL